MSNLKDNEAAGVKLPVEVWEEVLKMVPNRRELSLVSRDFHEAVQTIEGNKIVASINCFDVVSSSDHKLNVQN
jgi:hypothetical protein